MSENKCCEEAMKVQEEHIRMRAYWQEEAHKADVRLQAATTRAEEAEAEVNKLKVQWQGTTAIIQKGTMSKEDFFSYQDLQAKLEEAEKEVGRLKETWNNARQACIRAESKLAQLQARVLELEGALQYYATFFDSKEGRYRREDMVNKPEFFVTNLPQVAEEILNRTHKGESRP